MRSLGGHLIRVSDYRGNGTGAGVDLLDDDFDYANATEEELRDRVLELEGELNFYKPMFIWLASNALIVGYCGLPW